MEHTAQQAARLTGCSASQLRYWDRIGLVRPSASGPGRSRAYAFRDLVALRVVRSLLDGGLSLQRIRRAAAFLQESGDDLEGLRLVTDGSNVFACRDDGQVLDALGQGQMALFVSVDALVSEVEAEVREFRADREAFLGTLREQERAAPSS